MIVSGPDNGYQAQRLNCYELEKMNMQNEQISYFYIEKDRL
jgi:hypothetical protein